MSPFYAYVQNVADDNTWRFLLTFASQDVCDEWWRVVSTPPSPWASSMTRINPQFYTHNANLINIWDFFNRADFVASSRAFIGRFFLTLLNDKGGRTLSIIPETYVTDNISGNWFFIRSKSDPRKYWFCPGADQLSVSPQSQSIDKIVVSTVGRTRFRLQLLNRDNNLRDGTAVLIGSDQITISISETAFVGPRGRASSGDLVVANGLDNRSDIRFADLRDGFKTRTQLSKGLNGETVYVEDIVRVNGSGDAWELAI
ncbi:hypothetical protein JAAARDRAFT_205263 [Jaapia argillacea MUCL 33604]|uniref:Uncharacterized protein n=1 Tax=Jaapia argillacea MUCL 33604 TaxID=933084 RepID=A0A067PZN7_9AGAM|nr:hypothetical protein JAAARDRAFT_205263 [Jaapia argillacea MUCL 33604]